MRIAGLEPVCLAAPEPKSGVSASSTISAGLPFSRAVARSPKQQCVFYTIVLQKSSAVENFFGKRFCNFQAILRIIKYANLDNYNGNWFYYPDGAFSHLFDFCIAPGFWIN